MFMDLMLKPVEWTVNRFCAHDECFFPRIQPYINKVMRVQSREGMLSCDCVIQADHLYFYADSGREPDVTILLSAQFLKEFLCDPTNPLVFFTNAYEIQGDMALAEGLKACFASLDLDLEAHLADVVGDPLAVNLTCAASLAGDWGKSTASTIKENMRDYLQEEAELLVPAILVDEFVADTHVLRDDVERLEVRIRRIEKKREQACGS